jgi:predicted RNA-binding Zn-ribbon protein involved in translation (DUF1610 family)
MEVSTMTLKLMCTSCNWSAVLTDNEVPTHCPYCLENAVETLITKAQEHGEDTKPDMEVGDLQDILRRCWEIMSVDQRTKIYTGTLGNNNALNLDGLKEHTL